MVARANENNIETNLYLGLGVVGIALAGWSRGQALAGKGQQGGACLAGHPGRNGNPVAGPHVAWA